MDKKLICDLIFVLAFLSNMSCLVITRSIVAEKDSVVVEGNPITASAHNLEGARIENKTDWAKYFKFLGTGYIWVLLYGVYLWQRSRAKKSYYFLFFLSGMLLIVTLFDLSNNIGVLIGIMG